MVPSCFVLHATEVAFFQVLISPARPGKNTITTSAQCMQVQGTERPHGMKLRDETSGCFFQKPPSCSCLQSDLLWLLSHDLPMSTGPVACRLHPLSWLSLLSPLATAREKQSKVKPNCGCSVHTTVGFYLGLFFFWLL